MGRQASTVKTAEARLAYSPAMTARPGRALATIALVAALAAGACQGNPQPSAPSTAGSSTTPGTSNAPGSGLPGASPQTRTPSPALSGMSVTLEPFATIPGGPLAMTAPDDGSGRLFVAAQDGKIWVVERDGTVRPEPLVDLGPRLRSGGEQGLLGLATHPTFPTDPRIFVNYTDRSGDTIVASLTLDPDDANRLDPDSHRQLLFVDQPYANHNGGGAIFGPDGDLYVSLGDGGSGGDPQGNGQRLDTLLGKILRLDIDVAPEAGYASPTDNPFAGGGGLPEILHYGLRNPWRLSFDRATGDLWIGDVGQNLFEEVDVARAGASGINFGWNVMEGSHCYNATACDTAGLQLPVSDYGRDLGCTVIGGYVYRGKAHPFLVGTYLFADYCTGRIFALDAGSDALVAPVQVGAGSGSIAAFGEDADGELYVLSLGGEAARVVAAQR
jgi:glucose/arabinose dehydrogenase